jgi:transcriptional regulator with XRE-family HTH domain
MNQHSAPPGRKGGSQYLDGAKLRELRTSRALTQVALAESVDAPPLVRMTQNRLTHLEAGHDGCGIETILRLAEALDCQPEELMHAEGTDRYRALIGALSSAA